MMIIKPRKELTMNNELEVKLEALLKEVNELTKIIKGNDEASKKDVNIFKELGRYSQVPTEKVFPATALEICSEFEASKDNDLHAIIYDKLVKLTKQGSACVNGHYWHDTSDCCVSWYKVTPHEDGFYLEDYQVSLDIYISKDGSIINKKTGKHIEEVNDYQVYLYYIFLMLNE